MIAAGEQTKIDQARRLIQESRHLVAFTGAGLSTPSGIPDFRSKGTGLWERFDPMEVASLTTFRTAPTRFWDWKRPLMRQIWQAQPNPAHMALAQLEAQSRLSAVITQNIDGLHQRAGSRAVFELHGTVETMTCPACRKQVSSSLYRQLIEESDEIPRCEACGRIMKPDVVLFEENLPTRVWQAAEEHCTRADVILVAGSSLEVWPAATLPEMAVSHGARLIIANLSPTFLDSQALVLLPFDVAEALPLILKL